MQDILLFIQHHWMLNIAFLVVLFVLIVLEFFHQKRNTTKASPAEVTQLINRSNATLIDIRDKAAYTAGHIIGALSIPAADLPKQSKKLEKLRVNPIVFVCAEGTESARAADPLLKQNYNVRVLAGGINAWRNADLPLVKG
jgi:rhodanese-related sulfurtransferase